MDLAPIRYARAPDGVSIAYAVVGEGPPLVVVPGWASHLELSLAWSGGTPGFQTIFFDKRGTGLSDRDCEDYSLDARLRDLEAVVDAIGLDRFDLRGGSEGGPIAIRYAAQHPERVAHLVLYGTFARGDLVPREVFEALLALTRAEWGVAAHAFAAMFLPGGSPREVEAFLQTQRMGATADDAARLWEELPRIDVSPLLPLIDCPTLIVHAHGDRVVPFEHARILARDIRQSRLVPIDSDRHWPGAAERELLDRACREFLVESSTTASAPQDGLEVTRTGAPRATAPDPRHEVAARDAAPARGSRVLTTVLFTDIVGSTERAVDLGDEQWTRLLDQHHRLARRTVERLGGRWIKSTGDGVLATFDRPAQAVEAARAMRNDLQRLGVVIRAGIHTGEVEQQKDDIGGIGVHIAGRISAAASDGEIFVSPTVAALVLGSGLDFEERDEVALKGVPGRWRLSALRP